MTCEPATSSTSGMLGSDMISPPNQSRTQDNVLDALTDAVLPRDVLLKKGMTLDQLGGLLALHPLKVEVRHAGDTTLEEFRASSAKYLETENHFVLVNYLRMAIG